MKLENIKTVISVEVTTNTYTHSKLIQILDDEELAYTSTPISKTSPTPSPSKELTAMQKAIEDITFMRDRCEHPFATIAYGMAISICELHLETEMQQIFGAYTAGNRLDVYDGTETIGEKYYTTKYLQ